MLAEWNEIKTKLNQLYFTLPFQTFFKITIFEKLQKHEKAGYFCGNFRLPRIVNSCLD